ncbi:MAG: hypothetical protein WBA41_33045, partial [Rivularia sp. (in: cyanobacteria)]
KGMGRWGDGGMGRQGDGEMGGWGDKEMGRQGDKETRGWGDKGMGRWGDKEGKKKELKIASLTPNCSLVTGYCSLVCNHSLHPGVAKFADSAKNKNESS